MCSVYDFELKKKKIIVCWYVIKYWGRFGFHRSIKLLRIRFFFTSFASRYWFDQVVLGSTQTIRFFSFVSCQQSFHWHLLILSALADYISVICFSLGTRSSAYFSSISSIRENETADSIEFWIFSSLQTKIFTLCDCKKKNSDLILPRCWIADAVLIDHHRPHSNHQYRRSPDAQLSSRFTRACSAHD